MKYLPIRGYPGTAVKILAFLVRWSWRICSSILILAAAIFIMIGLSQDPRISTDPHDLFLIAVTIITFAAMIFSWWRELLGGLIILIILASSLVSDMATSLYKTGKIAWGMDAPGYALLIIPLMILLSWSLHALTNEKAGPRSLIAAAAVTPVFIVVIILCALSMLHAPFNP